MSELERQYSIYDDPGYKALNEELKYATKRGLLNGAIVVADFFPGFEAASYAADGIKMARRGAKMLGIKRKVFDFTPDVDWKLAVSTEMFEIPLGGATPTHSLEFLLQITYDADRLWRYMKVQRMASRGIDHHEIRDYLYKASAKDRIFEDLRPKLPAPLSDLSAQEILDLVPKPLL